MPLQTVPLLTQGATWDNVTYIVAWYAALLDSFTVQASPIIAARSPDFKLEGCWMPRCRYYSRN